MNDQTEIINKRIDELTIVFSQVMELKAFNVIPMIGKQGDVDAILVHVSPGQKAYPTEVLEPLKPFRIQNVTEASEDGQYFLFGGPRRKPGPGPKKASKEEAEAKPADPKPAPKKNGNGKKK